MNWVVQENLYNEEAFDDLIRALEYSNTARYEIVKIIPFAHELVPEPQFFEGLTTVIGSTALTFIGIERGWKVFYNDNFNHRAWVKAIGNELLNFDAIVGEFDKIDAPWDEFFIRPVEDRKLFAGQIINKESFENWKLQTKNAHKDGYTTLTPKTEVIISSIKNIGSEWRFFVVKGKIVTGSLYKRYGVLYQAPIQHNEEVLNYVQIMVDKWQPDDAFVIDVALTENGYKVIEYNCMNSCGFYKSDVGKIVKAVENINI